MNMLEFLKKRRSIRKFADQPVDEAVLNDIAKAVLVCPTSMNRKSTEVVVVTNPDTLKKLAECKLHSGKPLQEAQAALAVVADTAKIDVWVEDAAIAAFAMQLAIEAHGLGSVWIQMRCRRSQEGEPSEDAVRRVLRLPDRMGVLCVVALGHKGEEKPSYTEEDMDFSRLHREHYQEPPQ